MLFNVPHVENLFQLFCFVGSKRSYLHLAPIILLCIIERAMLIGAMVVFFNIGSKFCDESIPTFLVRHILFVLTTCPVVLAGERRASHDTRGRFFPPLAVSGDSQSLQRAYLKEYDILTTIPL